MNVPIITLAAHLYSATCNELCCLCELRKDNPCPDGLLDQSVRPIISFFNIAVKKEKEQDALCVSRTPSSRRCTRRMSSAMRASDNRLWNGPPPWQLPKTALKRPEEKCQKNAPDSDMPWCRRLGPLL